MGGSFSNVYIKGATIDTAVLDNLAENIKPKASKIVSEYGLRITGDAAQLAPVDTGALRNSITAESHMENDLLFIVQDGVEYGIYQEFGTSRMAAQPFLIPAFEKWVDKFQQAFKAVFE